MDYKLYAYCGAHCLKLGPWLIAHPRPRGQREEIKRKEG